MALNRREAIKKAAYFMGGTLSAPAIVGIMQGCAPSPKPNWTPAFFSEEQALTIMELAETILPATETLGAKDLGVPKFIEEMVSIIYKAEDRNRFMTGLEAFTAETREKHGDAFFALESAQRMTIAEEKNAFITNKENRKAWGRDTPFFWMVKELTLLGYFTTEYGATKILQYKLVPATFDGCMPLDQAGEGRTWAT